MFALAVAGSLAACGSSEPQVAAADLNEPVAQPADSIDTFAANAMENEAFRPRRVLPVTASPATRVDANSGSSDRSVSAPPARDSVAAARAVVTLYFDAIDRGDYDAAYDLWEQDGRASGMDRRSFALHQGARGRLVATLGSPGPIDAGAGQRYVTIPLTLREQETPDERGERLTGSVTLHRTADIDGATAAQRRWQIRAMDLTASPPPSPAFSDATGSSATLPDGVPATAEAHYLCSDGTVFDALFDNVADQATLTRDGAPLAKLSGQRPASGIWYKGDGYELRGKGNSANLTVPGGGSITCTADATAR